MTTWQLDTTGRFPQACFEHVKALAPATVEEAYLLACAWLIDAGFYYENNDEARLTGHFGFVDCSGMVVLATNVARAVMGLPAVNVPGNSGLMARACHSLPRPQWLTALFGPGLGYGITAGQANATPASLAFHGGDEGQDGFGDAGHVLSKYFVNRPGDPHAGPGVSIEAMSHALDLRYSTFVEPADSYFALSPWLGNYAPPAPPRSELDMLVFLPPHAKSDKDGNTEHAQFWPAGTNPFLPNGAIILRWGARIKGDRALHNAADPHQRVLTPAAGHKWIGCAERGDAGLMVVNELADTSGGASFTWLP